MSGPLDKARAAWGDDLPDWVETLAIECGRTSQNKVAKLLDRSPTTISLILGRNYPGEMASMAERVRGVFMDAVIDCPAVGEMPAQRCQDWRASARVFTIGNPERRRMYRACHRCPRFNKEAPNAE